MSKAPTNDAYRHAAKAIEQSWQAIETLISQTPNDDHYALGLLGPILSELRNAQSTIERLAPQQNNA